MSAEYRNRPERANATGASNSALDAITSELQLDDPELIRSFFRVERHLRHAPRPCTSR